MLDGKMLREGTGTPIRRMERANSSLALADPEPFTLANFTTKSLVAFTAFDMPGLPWRYREGISACPRRRSGSVRRTDRNAGRDPRPSPSHVASATDPRCRGPASDAATAP